MPGVDIETFGFDDLILAMSDSEERKLKAIWRVVRAMGNKAFKYAKYSAPVLSGFLQSNIDYQETGEIEVMVISNAYYSFWVEFGHLTKAGTFVPPNPYMERAQREAEGIAEETDVIADFAVAIMGEPGAGIGKDAY